MFPKWERCKKFVGGLVTRSKKLMPTTLQNMRMHWSRIPSKARKVSTVCPRVIGESTRLSNEAAWCKPVIGRHLPPRQWSLVGVSAIRPASFPSRSSTEPWPLDSFHEGRTSTYPHRSACCPHTPTLYLGRSLSKTEGAVRTGRPSSFLLSGFIQLVFH